MLFFSAVLSLGHINWLNPAFHNEKCLWPVGFASRRIMATPASGKLPTPHLCQVLEHQQHGGPVFR